MQSTAEPTALPTMKQLKPRLAPYARPDERRSLWQLANSLIPYFALWAAMIYTLQASMSYWITLGLAVLAAGFLVRIFIIFHDCGHNSFFRSTRANKRVGFLLGLLVFTPSEHWWRSHAIHHATSGNLDKRGIGDVTMLTAEEFENLPWTGRLGYRLFRNPFIMFGLGPLFMFLLMHRLPSPKLGRRYTLNVLLADLGIVLLAAAVSLAFGFRTYVLVQLPVIWMGGMVGIWMFYIQHQFEDTYFVRSDRWNFVAAGLLGTSFYRLPRLLQWFTGNIGFHHLHHLNPSIPNYNLEAARQAVPEIFPWEKVIEPGKELSALRCKLYDEPRMRMIGFPPWGKRRTDAETGRA